MQLNLPESDVPLVGSALGVLVDGVGVTAGLVLHDALAVSLNKNKTRHDDKSLKTKGGRKKKLTWFQPLYLAHQLTGSRLWVEVPQGQESQPPGKHRVD